MRLYKDDLGLCRRVARFIHAGLSAAQPGIVVATPPHLAGIARELDALGRDAAALQATGDLQCLEAPALLETFMVGDQPDTALFRAGARELFQSARRGRSGATVYVYGEMVDLLWQSGRTAAAMRLEVLWSQLAAVESFSLLCGYPREISIRERASMPFARSTPTSSLPSWSQPPSVAPRAQRRDHSPPLGRF